jgi:glycosyltransferase involved in cell wall biosynthesis
MIIFSLYNLVFIVFCASVFVSLVFLLFFQIRLAVYRPENSMGEGSSLPVSIIICAQNEYENLTILLPKIFEQDYPQFEVILVDDGSTDDTTFLLQSFVQSEPRLHIIELSESVKNKQGKKFALMMGLKGAKYDHVLLTDSDCIPASREWIRSMMKGFSSSREIVLGYSPYEKRPGFLNLFIRFETFMTGSQYLSFALAKIPYMGVGRNLAYHKHLFFDNKGFSSHIHLMSGDDDLFINQVADAKNTEINIDKESFMVSQPKISFGDYLHQKSRHLSVGKYYKSNHKFLLTLPVIATILEFISFVFLLFLPGNWLLVMGIFGTLTLIAWIIYYSISRKLGDPILGALFPALLLLYHLYLLGMSFSGLFYKTKSWK